MVHSSRYLPSAPNAPNLSGRYFTGNAGDINSLTIRTSAGDTTQVRIVGKSADELRVPRDLPRPADLLLRIQRSEFRRRPLRKLSSPSSASHSK